MQLPTIQAKNPRIRLLLAVILVLAAVGWFLSRASRMPKGGSVSVPVPADLDRMEPQLQAYLKQQIRVANKAPNDASAQALLGLVYAANQLWNEAASAFSNASKLNPKDPLPLLYRGVASEELGQPDQALIFYKETMAAHPGFPQGHWRLGDLALRQGDLALARPAFEKLTVLAPGEWRGHTGLGHVCLLEGSVSNAIVCLEKAVRLDPSARSTHHLLGLAYRTAGRARDAERELRRGQDGLLFPMPDPWNIEAPKHMRLPQDIGEAARQLLLQGDLQQAASLMASALAYRPNSLSLLLNFAEILLQDGKLDKALQLLEKAQSIDATHVPILLIKSSVLLGMGKAEEALRDAERAVLLMPSTPKPLITRADALIALTRFDEAIKSLQEARAADPKNALIEVEIGDIQWRSLNDPELALASYRKALETDPDLVEGQLRIAELSIELKAEDAAMAALEAIREIDPRNEGAAVLRKRLQQTRGAPAR